jgi:hypothetical protein
MALMWKIAVYSLLILGIAGSKSAEDRVLVSYVCCVLCR